MDSGNLTWVTVKTFMSRAEAEIVKGLLEQHEIPAIVRADDEGGMTPSMGYVSGVKLQVRQIDLEYAASIIQDYTNEESAH